MVVSLETVHRASATIILEVQLTFILIICQEL